MKCEKNIGIDSNSAFSRNLKHFLNFETLNERVLKWIIKPTAFACNYIQLIRKENI